MYNASKTTVFFKYAPVTGKQQQEKLIGLAR